MVYLMYYNELHKLIDDYCVNSLKISIFSIEIQIFKKNESCGVTLKFWGEKIASPCLLAILDFRKTFFHIFI